MQHQLHPSFIIIAFAFLFEFGVGSPDLRNRSQWRRDSNAPRVDFPQFAAALVRRIEGQFRRDWIFVFAAWNLIFRSVINPSRYIFKGRLCNGTTLESEQITAEQYCNASKAITAILTGSYLTTDGSLRQVNGDLSKVSFVPNLPPLARDILQNVQNVSTRIEGTHEVRRLMRHEIQAFRVFYGAPLIVTFSPNERHNTLMLRLSRRGRNDPVCIAQPWLRQWGGHAHPSVQLPIDSLISALPSYEQRKLMLSQDPLACMSAFRIIVRLAMSTIFGVRVCLCCPRCTSPMGKSACQNIFGSVASSEGGFIGRLDACLGSIENQKEGVLHIHWLLWPQCLSQFSSIHDISLLIKKEGEKLVKQYTAYKSYVCQEVYHDLCGFHMRRKILEDDWPEYDSTFSFLFRSPLCPLVTDTTSDDTAMVHLWSVHHCKEVQTNLEHWNHHIHPLANTDDPEAGRLLAGCVRKGEPNVCKYRFPRDKELVPEASILCYGLACQFGLKVTGQRNALGSLHGPRNCGGLNGTHPLLTSLLRCNSDVQVLYRLPICPETHSKFCATPDTCLNELATSNTTIEIALQLAQDSAIGYFSDYFAKGTPIATKEITRWLRAHDNLSNDLQQTKRPNSIQYIARLHTQRFLSDTLARGTAHGAVDVVNLMCNRRQDDVTAAECVKTAITTTFAGNKFVSLLERKNGNRPTKRIADKVVFRVSRTGKAASLQAVPDRAMMDGYRGKDPRVHWLSPYEFVSRWRLVPVSFPINPRLADGDPKYHADLTSEGRAYICTQKLEGEGYEFHPGKHFRIRNAGGTTWIPFLDLPALEKVRHLWVMEYNPRPFVPMSIGSPMARNNDQEQTAKVCSAYFRPYFLHQDLASQHVPYVDALSDPKHGFHSSWKAYVSGNILTLHMTRVIQQFLCVSRVRCKDDILDTAEAKTIPPLKLDHTQLDTALNTKTAKKGVNESKDKQISSDSVTGINLAHEAWRATNLSNIQYESNGPGPVYSNLRKLLQSARNTARAEPTTSKGFPTKTNLEPTVDPIPSISLSKLDAALAICIPQLNKGQQIFLQMVANRVKEEVTDDINGMHGSSEPLRWMLHGGPGTGKSKALGIIVQFFELLGYVKDKHIEIGAFQGKMARLIGGSTLHQLGAMNLFGNDASKEKSTFLFLRHCTLRWIIIDEISMVNPRLLAKFEERLRTHTQKAGTYKCDPDGTIRPFGGFNINLCGYFWQIPPPGEDFSLMSLPPSMIVEPTKKNPNALTSHGLNLLWGNASQGIQGMNELIQNMRFQGDPCFQAALEECRHGKLRNETYDWLVQFVLCGPHDPRLTTDHFSGAKMIVATNDLKYAINKQCAILYASSNKKHLTWCPAFDRPTTDGITKTDADTRIRWLQYHDRWTANLYGMLPLVQGLPIALTEHVDRPIQKNLLRGTEAFLDSWILDPRKNSVPEKAGVRILRYVPAVLFIQVPDANWIVPGLTRPGLYPILPTSKIWYLDKNKKNPVLSVSRRQFPIGPAFGITCHSSQGQTLNAAIIDLIADDPILCYVAFSRVRSSSDLLIYRLFPKEIFQRGERLGPTFLLKRLREKTLTYITTRHLISMQVAATCMQCGCQDYHDIGASNLPNPPPFACDDCAHDVTTMKFCNKCGLPKPMPCFSPSNWQMPFEKRRCKQCCKQVANRVICPSCQQQRMASDISARGTCNRCTTATCASCQQERMASEINTRGTCNPCTKINCPSCQQERMASEISARGTCNRNTKVTCPSCSKSAWHQK